jgi:hypothetical protein
MGLFRPHTLSFQLPGTPGGQDDDGLPTEGTPGLVIQYPCRFHSESSKVFKNQDSTEVAQVGTIRLDVVDLLPTPGQTVSVTDGRNGMQLFAGPVREVYPASLSSRLEV